MPSDCHTPQAHRCSRASVISSRLRSTVYRYVRRPPCARTRLGFDAQGRGVHSYEPGPLPPRSTADASLAALIARLR